MFKVNNEAQLVNLLKLISEEAVKFTKKQLNESDPFDDYYQGLRNQEKSMFEREDLDAETSPPAPEPSASSKSDESEQDTPDAEEKASEESFVGSKDRLVDFVNDIRSAPSLKDSAVDEQVSAYYDRLSSDERDVLVFFLRELSRVMTGKASGQEARDPSDPPLNIDFVSKEKAKTETRPDQGREEPKGEDELVDAPTQDDTPKPDEEEEDTSPPIKVNENQDHSAIRQKIRTLFIR